LWRVVEEVANHGTGADPRKLLGRVAGGRRLTTVMDSSRDADRRSRPDASPGSQDKGQQGQRGDAEPLHRRSLSIALSSRLCPRYGEQLSPCGGERTWEEQ
jgi:hypothetical protein